MINVPLLMNFDFRSNDSNVEFLTVELPYLWVIAQIFRQIRVHSSKFVLFEDFLLKKILKV